MIPILLEVEGAVKAFDGFLAVRDVHLRIGRGELAAMIGPNGAGKTTLFNLITGHLPLDRGRIRFKGEEIAGLPPHRIARRGVGRSFQRINIFPRLTVFENVQAAVLAHRGKALDLLNSVGHLFRDETQRLLADVGLGGKGRMVAGSLAYGDQKQLELAIALASEPELLLLDEPTAGMSAQETHQTIALIERIARQHGLTLLFTEHDMSVVFSIAERITVMHQGEIIADGTPEEVRTNPEVQRVYLGQHRR